MRLRAGRVTRAHERLESEHESAPDPDLVVARAEVLYGRIVRANRASQALTALTLVWLGVSVGLSVRGRRVERARLRGVVSGEVAGWSRGLAGELR